MVKAGDKSGGIDLIPEGFRVTWDSQGLEIRVTNEPSAPLRLTWAQLRDLASRAGVAARSDANAQRGAIDRSDN